MFMLHLQGCSPTELQHGMLRGVVLHCFANPEFSAKLIA